MRRAALYFTAEAVTPQRAALLTCPHLTAPAFGLPGDMQRFGLKTPFCSSLYEFWSDAVYQELTREDHTILNLTSAEYRRAVEPYLTAQDRFITCQFLEVEPGRRLEKGVYVKMARGEMVRFLAEQSAQEPETAKQFCRLGFSYQEELSDEGLYVFTRPRDWKKGAAYEKSVD